MAEDWIKMRTDLYRDPKVCAMADLLMGKDSPLARYVDQNCQRAMTVTRNVMRNVTVGALVSVWGVMRLRGKRDDFDLLCRAVTLGVVDDIAEIPGFGKAMEAVGWAEETEEGVIFPRFFQDYNVDPEGVSGNSDTTGAVRQRRYRQRQKEANLLSNNVTDDVTDDVTSNGEIVTGDITETVTVTSRNVTREEKRREEVKAVERASRLPADWSPGQDEIAFCKAERPDLNPRSVADQFRDYWVAQPGAKGRKTDWPATWRNWVRNQRASKPINGHDSSPFA